MHPPHKPTGNGPLNACIRILSSSHGAAAVLAALCVYYATSPPGLTFIDSGELAAVCATAGIAHPTGYPLYTVIGWITALLWPAKPVAALNMLSAVCACAALAAFYYMLALLLGAEEEPGRRARALPLRTSRFTAACGTLLLAFSRPFWEAALITEVYALQSLLLCLLMLVSLRACAVIGPAAAGSMRWQAALFFCAALTLTNHMTAVYYLPALAYLIASGRSAWRLSVKKAAVLAAACAAGLAPYLYLPFRAAQNPRLNWGDPSTAASFLRHVTGRQYSVWMFSSADTALEQSRYFFSLVPEAVGYVPLALALPGIWFLIRTRRRLWWFSFILFIASLAGALSYDIVDIDPYFMPAFVCIALWAAAGFHVCVVRTAGVVSAPACCLLAAFPLVINWAAADQGGNTLVRTYCTNILDSSEPNALIFSYQWDYFCSPALYLQMVEGIRPDVTVIETKLLKRSWYLRQLESNHPGLMNASRGALERYRRELHKFERGKPFDPAVIQKRYSGLINSFIQSSMPHRPVYVTGEQPPYVGKGFCRVPEGLAFRLAQPPAGYRPFATLSRLQIPPAERFKPDSRYHQSLRSFYAGMLAARASYELEYSRPVKARALIARAGTVYPEHSSVQKIRSALQAHDRAGARSRQR